MTKHLLSLFLLAAAAVGAQAQNTVLLADTAMYTHAGGGNNFSAWFEPGGLVWGTAGNQGAGVYSAENFTVPAGGNWFVDSVMVFAYQTGTAPTTSPFTAGYAMLYNGDPMAGGTMIAGDTTTNRMAYQVFSGIYRTDTVANIATTTRPVYRIAMRGFTNSLAPGNYWVAWGVAGLPSFTGPFINPKVLAGTGGGQPTNPPGQNARTRAANGTWSATLDGSTPLGLNFILKGRGTPASVDGVISTPAFQLNAPFPNPASGTANLSFTLGAKSHVNLHILNVAGQQVSRVVDAEMTAGEYLMPCNISALAAGTYRVVLQTDAGSTSVQLRVK